MVVVLETASSVQDFARAVARIDGMEWLAEVGDIDLDADEDFGPLEDGGAFRGTAYLLFADRLALQQLLSAWRRREQGGKALYGRAPLARVFDLLLDVRPWDARDRVRETGLAEELSILPSGQSVRIEIDLWYRQTSEQRAQAESQVRQAISQAGGDVTDDAVIVEAEYHGVLAYLPRAAAEALVHEQDAIELATLDAVMYLRPQPQGIVMPHADDAPEGASPAPQPHPDLPPILALLDGLPQANHPDLADRLTIVDGDDVGSEYAALERKHGTAMASLVVRGDLSAPGPPLRRRVLVRPVLAPDPDDWRSPRAEAFPRNELAVHFLHRVLQELLGGPLTSPPAPDVEIVNLSIGDPARVYAQSLSPLARLLDWAANHFNVLIIVSAGNHDGALQLDITRGEITGAGADGLEQSTIQTLRRDARLRRLLSPAEAVNVLTVGATADDDSVASTDGRVDPLVSPSLPAAYSALGGGYRRSIKPDFVLEGGRLRYRLRPGADDERAVLDAAPASASPPGQLVAAPGSGSRRLYLAGTSNAAALTSRLAAELWETVDAMPDRPEWLTREVRPTLVRALLVHAARWGTALDAASAALANVGTRERKRLVERLVGYGRIDRSLVTDFQSNRVVLLGGGRIAAETAQEHLVPLPASLNAIAGQRRIASTLAWTSPCNVRSYRYRGVSLKLSDGSSAPLKNMLSEGADFDAARRGTVEHHVKRGVSAVPLAPDAALRFQVDCATDGMAAPPPVHYALVVTVDVAPELGIDVYTEITSRLAVQPPVRVRA